MIDTINISWDEIKRDYDIIHKEAIKYFTLPNGSIDMNAVNNAYGNKGIMSGYKLLLMAESILNRKSAINLMKFNKAIFKECSMYVIQQGTIKDYLCDKRSWSFRNYETMSDIVKNLRRIKWLI